MWSASRRSLIRNNTDAVIDEDEMTGYPSPASVQYSSSLICTSKLNRYSRSSQVNHSAIVEPEVVSLINTGFIVLDRLVILSVTVHMVAGDFDEWL